MALLVEAFDFSGKFVKELERLDSGTQTAARKALALLQSNPNAKSLRLHALSGFARPAIWKIDVYSNKSYQITFEMAGRVAQLKRIATHAEIDRAPRG